MATKKTKVIDKWKLKKWYSVIAPPMFDNREFCEIVASDESSLPNRVIKTKLSSFISSSSQFALFCTLLFRVTEVKGNQVFTKLIGHEIAPIYISSLARRGKDVINVVVDVVTKDNEEVRVKVVGITAGKISENTARSLRAALADEIKKSAATASFDEFMSDILYGKLVTRLFNKVKQITTMKRIEIRKTERKERFT
jgi:small subunit ribosomal protein S3Ae